MEYQESLNHFKFGIMKYNYKNNYESIVKADKLLNKFEYNNLLFNNYLANSRNIHPLIYTINDNGIIYKIVKTHSSNVIKTPIKDEMFIGKQESTKVYEILKGAYLSDSIYVLQLKDKLELDNVITNIEDDDQLMYKYFHNESARLYQKEKLFAMLFKNAFNEDLNLVDNDLKVNIQIPTKVSLIDVTNSIYVSDNIDRIINYEKYYIES
jgi:hypothetical protein